MDGIQIDPLDFDAPMDRRRSLSAKWINTRQGCHPPLDSRYGFPFTAAIIEDCASGSIMVFSAMAPSRRMTFLMASSAKLQAAYGCDNRS